MAAKVILSLIVVAVAAMLYVYHCKLAALRAQSYEHAFVLPLCRTFASIIKGTPSDALPALLSSLENSQFRTVNVTVFSDEGEVWADSLQPSQGKLPLPASRWQSQNFRTIEGKLAAHPTGVVETIFRPCSPQSTAYETSFISAVRISELKLVVVVTQCGAE